MSIVFIFAAMIAPETAMTANGADSESQPAASESQKDLPEGLADLIPKAAALKERSYRLTQQLATMPKGDRIEPHLKRLEAQVDTLEAELAELKQQERRQYERLLAFRRAIEEVDQELKVHNDPLIAGLRKIDQWRNEWLAELKHWQSWKSSISEDPVLDMVQGTFDSSMQIITDAQERIFSQMETLMTPQKRMFDIQVRINEMLIELEPLIAAARGEFLRDFSPPMYSTSFYAQFGSWLPHDFISGVAGVSIPNSRFFIRNGWVIALQLILTLALAFSIRRSERILGDIDSLGFMQLRPYSAGGLIAASFCWSLYASMPAMWQLLQETIILTTAVRLVAGMVKHRRQFLMICLLVAILLSTRVLIIIELPSPLFRIYLSAINLSIAVWCLHLLRRPPSHRRSRIYTAILVGMALASGAVAIIEISGYSSLALHMFRSALITVFIVVLAWLMMLLVRGLLESAFRSRYAQKIPFLQTYATAFVEHATKVLNTGILLLFCGAVLQTWRVFTTSWELIYRIFTFGITVGGTRFTIWLVLAAAASLYGAILISRLLQYFLMRNIFARRRVDPGIGISITRLLHYAIVLVGILLALATLGFKLTNLTIIVSALGVGIGFGLQTIVNNFVCGLILLFERPVKVGDVIQLGDQWATIRDIGLRATTIQTFDRSDIVVPNSDLITNQVTNWTLADRNMRLTLSVGVAYGSDVPLVLQTLQECTREHPRILEDPAPLIFFMGFGDSSLDFQLRVWIDNVDYMNVVRSELNQAIDRKFREHDIEIPFPQRDLHLRSVDHPAVSALTALPHEKTQSNDEVAASISPDDQTQK